MIRALVIFLALAAALNGAMGQNTVNRPVWASEQAARGFDSVAIQHGAGINQGTRVSLPALLDSIREVENWDGADGRAGERGPYQITAAVWAMHEPGKSFAAARQEAPGRACALKHVRWLIRRLAAARIDPNAFNLALAYNAGLGAVLRGEAPFRSYEYAVRVSNLYNR